MAHARAIRHPIHLRFCACVTDVIMYSYIYAPYATHIRTHTNMSEHINTIILPKVLSASTDDVIDEHKPMRAVVPILHTYTLRTGMNFTSTDRKSAHGRFI